MLEGHISKSFDGDLATLQIRVLAMGGLALDQVRAAARAYAEWDVRNAKVVIERDTGCSTLSFASSRKMPCETWLSTASVRRFPALCSA